MAIARVVDVRVQGGASPPATVVEGKVEGSPGEIPRWGANAGCAAVAATPSVEPFNTPAN